MSSSVTPGQLKCALAVLQVFCGRHPQSGYYAFDDDCIAILYAKKTRIHQWANSKRLPTLRCSASCSPGTVRAATYIWLHCSSASLLRYNTIYTIYLGTFSSVPRPGNSIFNQRPTGRHEAMNQLQELQTFCSRFFCQLNVVLNEMDPNSQLLRPGEAATLTQLSRKSHSSALVNSFCWQAAV